MKCDMSMPVYGETLIAFLAGKEWLENSVNKDCSVCFNPPFKSMSLRVAFRHGYTSAARVVRDMIEHYEGQSPGHKDLSEVMGSRLPIVSQGFQCGLEPHWSEPPRGYVSAAQQPEFAMGFWAAKWLSIDEAEEKE